MKTKYISFIIVFVLSIGDVYSQWTIQNSNTTNPLVKVFFVNINTGIATGDNGTAVRTTNGGINWYVMQTNVTERIKDCYLLDAGTGFLLSESKLLKTVNGGANWNIIWDTGGDSAFGSISFFRNSSTGYLFGGCLIFKTTDVGETWVSVYRCPDGYGGRVSLGSPSLSNDTLMIAGGSMTELHFPASSCYAILSPSSDIQILGPYRMGTYVSWLRFAGNSGIGYRYESSYNLKSTNFGNGWLEYIQPLSGILHFYDNTFGFFLQYYNTFHFSTNSGDTWNYYDTVRCPALYDLQVLSNNVVTAIGDSGTIVRNSNITIGINSISSGIPQHYSLFQNYPNPFNPQTKIRFQIKSKGYSTIKIFDVLGNELNSLLNQQLNPGTYEVDFNAGNLPSGVYFYKLVSGEFTETKRMMLIK